MNRRKFENATGKSLALVVEPWATELQIEAGSIVEVVYPPPTDREDASSFVLYPDQITFWCEGETFEVEVDGVQVLT